MEIPMAANQVANKHHATIKQLQSESESTSNLKTVASVITIETGGHELPSLMCLLKTSSNLAANVIEPVIPMKRNINRKLNFSSVNNSQLNVLVDATATKSRK